MPQARHRAPARTPRSPRPRTTLARLATRLATLGRAEIGLLAGGGALVAIAAAGAALGSAGAPATEPLAHASQVVLATDEVEVLSDETLADLRDERLDSLEVSRAAERAAAQAALPEPAPAPALPATTPAYASVDANVRVAAAQDADAVATVAVGDEVAVTGHTENGYAQVVFDGALMWIYADYLAATPEEAEAAAGTVVADGISGAPCASGSGVEAGLSANAINVHRAVCALFPQVRAYGGLGGGGEHGSGHALDIMISSDVGTQIAEYVRANAGALGVSEVIWRQRIWTVQRSGEGWRWMEDRGSSTANHYDHVHVTVY